MDALPPIAVTMGEPAGIGPDLILRLYAECEQHRLPPFIVYGNLGFLAARARRLGLNIGFATSTPAGAAKHFPATLPVAHIDGLVPDKPGDTSPLSGKVVIEAIAQAVAGALDGDCRGVVTAPIHKAALYAAGFRHPGHTEYLAALCARCGVTPLPVMMLAHEALRVVPLTVHVPLREVPGLITPRLILETARIVEHDLRTRFDIENPHIAVAGLNPHAGEGGALGSEDLSIIHPAVLELQHNGIQIEGPFSADTIFHLPNWKKYDAVIAMYHDQALIPIKTLAFDEAVNITLGLPLVRTSPDHGTAFDLAGSGKGSAQSMLAALRLCDRLTGGAS
ncbi:MAG: 4-hydroxythreonine-4-phosphate dehydrogenase PdxA [Devosia sp.]